MLLYLWSKIIKKIRYSSQLNSKIDGSSKIESGTSFVNSELGRYSFCGYDCEVLNSSIGAFTSIANNVKIGGEAHPMNWVSTSSVFYKGQDSIKKKFYSHNAPNILTTKIGHDVWIGSNALIKQGITIGHGAVVGMGSIVTKNVAPYTVVAGNPAKKINQRFDDFEVKRLLEIEWWYFDDAKLYKHASYFNNLTQFLKKINE